MQPLLSADRDLAAAECEELIQQDDAVERIRITTYRKKYTL